MTPPPSAGAAGSRTKQLGLPDQIRACLFDLDGVLTQTAKIHAKAWKQTFDTFLHAYSDRTGRAFEAFDEVTDYELYVDGKPRADGVRAFLAARGIGLPEGDPAHSPGTETVQGLGNAKNQSFADILERDGIRPFDGSVRYLQAVRAANLPCAVVTSSANCDLVVKAAGIAGHFGVTIDGNDLKRLNLRGKPAPDTFLAAAHKLAVPPGEAAVFEDALAGVEAGRAGGFGLVVGVDRLGQADALRTHGADLVVKDLGELLDDDQ